MIVAATAKMSAVAFRERPKEAESPAGQRCGDPTQADEEEEDVGHPQ
jgi:hypothetical protein